MKKLFVLAIIMTFLFSGCSKKTYFTKDSAVYEITNAAANFNNYDGHNVITNLVKFDENDCFYGDDYLSIIGCERRLDVCIVSVLYYGGNLVQDAEFTFVVRDDSNNYINTISTTTNLVHGYVSNFVVPLQEGQILLLQSYSGAVKQVAKISKFNFGSDIVQQSQSTYKVKKPSLYYLLCDEVIVDSCKSVGTFVSGRQGIDGYLEIKIQ